MLMETVGRVHAQRQTRWPAEEAVFNVPGWVSSTPEVQFGDGDVSTGVLLRRVYSAPNKAAAVFDMWANPQPQAKMLFRKGPDRDFLGAGFTTQELQGLTPPIPGGGAMIAHRGQSAWLILYTFGERRGRLGAGLLAWGLAEADALWDSPNTYFLARVSVGFPASAEPPFDTARSLATPLFDSLEHWYASP